MKNEGHVVAETSRTSRRRFLLHILFLIGAILLEIRSYPIIASEVDGLFGGGGGMDSALGYFRDHYVAPGGVALIAFAVAGMSFAARRGYRTLHRAAIAFWVVNLAALFLSSVWYFHSVRAASNYGG